MDTPTFRRDREYLGRLNIGWRIRQIFPHTQWTAYGDAQGVNHFVIWKMWMGRCYDVIDVTLGASDRIITT